MSDPIKIEGLTFETVPVEVYQGFGGRVHANPNIALNDIAVNGLAKSFPNQMTFNRPFNEIIEHVTDNILWWEDVIVLARWRKANSLGSKP